MEFSCLSTHDNDFVNFVDREFLTTPTHIRVYISWTVTCSMFFLCILYCVEPMEWNKWWWWWWSIRYHIVL